jgi:TPR repeat protein
MFITYKNITLNYNNLSDTINTMAVFTEKVYATQYSKKMYVDELNKYIYETGCAAFPEPRHIIYKINEHYHNRMGTYRCPAEQTSSGQDMSYWEKYRISVFEDYKRDAFRSITPEWVRLVTNCKKLLVSDKYDMFEEFKRGYPHLSGYFDCKEITWDIIGDSHHTNITTFIDCVVTCLLSKETENKQNEKIRKQQELRKKQEEERKKQEEERKLLLYKKEFECAKLFEEIDKNKLNSSELYVEYKKITEIKDKGALYNTEFINYFTEDKKKYIRVLIELVTNPKPVSNEVEPTVTSEDVETLYRKGHACYFGRGVAQDYVEAARLYRLAAEQGDADAQLKLGFMFTNGQGVAQDPAEAARWYRLAAEQGDADAQFNLGLGFKLGEGVAQDYVEAARWFRLAAEQRYAYAEYNLGCLFKDGQGVAQDDGEAVRWFRLAAEQGLAIAQLLLGLGFKLGKGVKQDYVEAARWLRLAAEQGNANAQFLLGEMLLYGRGVVQDRAEAARLYRLAAAQGNKRAQSRIARYDPPLETAASSVATIDCPASVSPDCSIPPSHNHIESSVIFDSKNDENLIIRVSECNADSSVIFDSNNDVVIGLSECNAINIVVPQHPEGLGDAPPEPPAKKKRGRPSYKSLLLNLDKNTLRPKSVAGK